MFWKFKTSIPTLWLEYPHHQPDYANDELVYQEEVKASVFVETARKVIIIIVIIVGGGVHYIKEWL